MSSIMLAAPCLEKYEEAAITRSVVGMRPASLLSMHQGSFRSGRSEDIAPGGDLSAIGSHESIGRGS
jgi:hypothetical protein